MTAANCAFFIRVSQELSLLAGRERAALGHIKPIQSPQGNRFILKTLFFLCLVVTPAPFCALFLLHFRPRVVSAGETPRTRSWRRLPAENRALLAPATISEHPHPRFWLGAFLRLARHSAEPAASSMMKWQETGGAALAALRGFNRLPPFPLAAMDTLDAISAFEPALADQDDSRWAKVLARDASADGEFVYAVRTTGVFCRPSCSSRRPLRENASFHDDAQAAEAAGFRACKRCRPATGAAQDSADRRIAAACALASRPGEPPTLEQMAAAACLSPSRFHRLFKKSTGLTPAEWARAARDEALRQQLASPARDSILGAALDAGFGSSSRFYAAADAALGMSPSAWRAGGDGETIRFAVGECSLGSILAAQSSRGLCAILLGDDPQALVDDLAKRFPKAALAGADAALEGALAAAAGMVEASGAASSPPLDLRGTAFQLRVWESLRGLRPGETVSYSELARRIGAPSSARAVARAVGANPLAVAIPCHRVVREDGGLGGYRWGVERKRALLLREGARAAATDNAKAPPSR
jgi:AraC family transcriptional regulator, regulatory protein of adaptative response / methylated-DNA-[protein]-cysteine methyltransferase